MVLCFVNLRRAEVDISLASLLPVDHSELVKAKATGAIERSIVLELVASTMCAATTLA